MFTKIKKTAPNRYRSFDVITDMDTMEKPLNWHAIKNIAIVYGLSLVALLVFLFSVISIVRLAFSI